MVGRRGFYAAVRAGTRESLVLLAETLARDLDRVDVAPDDRLRLMRALRVVLRDLETLDQARQRLGRLRASVALSEAPNDPLDEILAARRRRNDRKPA